MTRILSNDDQGEVNKKRLKSKVEKENKINEGRRAASPTMTNK